MGAKPKNMKGLKPKGMEIKKCSFCKKNTCMLSFTQDKMIGFGICIVCFRKAIGNLL